LREGSFGFVDGVRHEQLPAPPARLRPGSIEGHAAPAGAASAARVWPRGLRPAAHHGALPKKAYVALNPNIFFKVRTHASAERNYIHATFLRIL